VESPTPRSLEGRGPVAERPPRQRCPEPCRAQGGMRNQPSPSIRRVPIRRVSLGGALPGRYRAHVPPGRPALYFEFWNLQVLLLLSYGCGCMISTFSFTPVHQYSKWSTRDTRVCNVASGTHSSEPTDQHSPQRQNGNFSRTLALLECHRGFYVPVIQGTLTSWSATRNSNARLSLVSRCN
jgi:hypothetical protein